MSYSFTRTQPNITWYGKPNTLRLIFRLWVSIAWLLLLFMGYPLFTYTSTNAAVMQRYSSSYAIGLLVYLIFLLGWLLPLFLPERYLTRVAQGVEYLNANPSSRAHFVMTWTFLALLALTTMRLWDWGYNPLLWLSIIGLASWLSALPLFWKWGVQGWRIKWVSLKKLYNWLAQNLLLWLPPIVGIGVLLISNILGFGAEPSELILIIGLPPAIIGFLILLRWPQIGLVILVITSLIVPSPNLPGGLNFAVVLLIMLIGVHLLNAIVHQHPARLIKSRPVLPLVALILSAVFAFGIGNLPWFGFAHHAPLDAQLGGLAIFILAGGIFLLVAHQVQELRWLQWLTWTFLAVGGLHTIGWIVPGIGPFTSGLFQPGVFNNSIFWILLVALSFSQAVFNHKLDLMWRLALGGLAISTLYVGYDLNSEWKSGYLPPMVSIAAIISCRSWRLGLAMVLIGIVPAMALGSEAIATDEYSYGTRVDAWLIMLEIIKFNPITGFGPANYYWYTPLFPIRGWAVQFNSHNQYIDILAQTGVIGLGCFTWFAWEVGWLGWRLRTKVPAGFAQAYVYGALGILAGMLASGVLVDWILPFTYNIGLTGFRASMLGWLFLGGLVSLERIYLNQDASK